AGRRRLLAVAACAARGRKPAGGAGIPQVATGRSHAFREPMNSPAAGARAVAAHAVARILREGVTLDAALHDALAATPTGLGPSVRSLSYGAVRGYYRHEAILSRLL